MPRKPVAAGLVYDEYDARAYRHLVPRERQGPPNPAGMVVGKNNVSKKYKHKSKGHKRNQTPYSEKGEKFHHGHGANQGILPSKPIVDYDDVSSDSDLSNRGHSPVTSRVSDERVDSRRDISPATAIRSYMKDRSRSPSPLRDSPPPYKSKKHKKRSRSSPSRGKFYDAPRAYSNHPPPRAYADPPKAYGGGRQSPPHDPSPRKRYRSPSPYGRKESRSRSR